MRSTRVLGPMVSRHLDKVGTVALDGLTKHAMSDAVRQGSGVLGAKRGLSMGNVLAEGERPSKRSKGDSTLYNPVQAGEKVLRDGALHLTKSAQTKSTSQCPASKSEPLAAKACLPQAYLKPPLPRCPIFPRTRFRTHPLRRLDKTTCPAPRHPSSAMLLLSKYARRNSILQSKLVEESPEMGTLHLFYLAIAKAYSTPQNWDARSGMG